MSASSSSLEVPRNVLLATDLSARGDRALERAMAIAADRKAHLTILHVLEEFDESNLRYVTYADPSWRAPPDALVIAKRRIREALHADLGEASDQATVLILKGEPEEVIERVAVSERIDLIVTGIASEGLFASRPVILGRTVEKLLRKVSVPILIVRNRPRAPYRHILVTTDFSEPSAQALQVALRLFTHQTLHLLHAFEVPHSHAVSDPHRQVEGFRQAAAMELTAFLDSMVLPEEARRRLVTLLEPGGPTHLVREYVRDRGADLVVLGSHGRGAMLEALLGSTAKNILSSLPCDALVVRGPRQRAPRQP